MEVLHIPFLPAILGVGETPLHKPYPYSQNIGVFVPSFWVPTIMAGQRTPPNVPPPEIRPY